MSESWQEEEGSYEEDTIELESRYLGSHLLGSAICSNQSLWRLS